MSPGTAASVQAPAADGGLLVDVLDDLTFTAPMTQQNSQELTTGITSGAEEGKFLLKNNGVLFENEVLQIGVKSEYKKNLGNARFLEYKKKIYIFFSPWYVCDIRSLSNLLLLGRIGVFYGNKSTTLQDFTTTLCISPELQECMMVDINSIPSTIEGGAQKQQLVDVECKNVFFEAPKLEISFK